MKDINFRTFLILWNRMQRQGTPAIHLRLASWLEQRWETGDKKLLILAFRSLGKSTIVGIFCTWLLWRNPDLRILVLAADLALARKMVRNVKRIVEKHPLTRALKPERLDQWGSDRFTLKRSKELRDPTMLAKGITTNLTGTRADIIICDDVEVPKTSDTNAKRENLRERLKELDYIMVPDGTQIYIGTPHHWDTIYADKKRVGGDEIFLDRFERIVIPVLNEKNESNWPERFSPEKIDAIRTKTGPSHFTSQMMCEPVNLAQGCFDPENIQVYDDIMTYTEAGGQPVLMIGKRKMISAVAWWDPAFGRETGDKSIVAIVYTDEKGEYFLHHLQALMTKPDSVISEMEQQCRKVGELIDEYCIPLIAVETNGIGQFLPGHLRRHLDEQPFKCGMIEITSRKPKAQRIMEGLEARLANRSLHVHRTALHNSFLSELRDWRPDRKHQKDDALDAVAGALTLTPVRISRIFGGGKKHNWMGNAKVQRARTEFEV